MEKKPKSFGTHDGTFHADEVSACALLLLFDLIDRSLVVRTRDQNQLTQCEFVCDVGGVYDSSRKLFDHHQLDYAGDLSSAGMVLIYLNESGKISDEEFHFFKNALIDGVDAHDNGDDPQIPGVETYSDVISNFTPIFHDSSPKEQNHAFEQALDFALGHLTRLHKRFHYILSCQDVVKEAMENATDFLLFDQSIPWMDSFFELGGESHSAQFIIMPTGVHWKLRGIPPSLKDRMKVRRPLPKRWSGLLKKELRSLTGIPGAIFCHKGGFISIWETKEDALKAWELQQKEPA